MLLTSLTSLLLLPQFSIDHNLETLKTPILQLLSINEYRRRAADARLIAFHEISIDQALDRLAVHILTEFIDIKTQLFRKIHKTGVVQTRHILKYLIMVRPEFSLIICSKCCCCSRAGEFMHLKRKVFFNQLDFLRVFFQHLLEERINPRAEWSLVVAEDRDGDRRFFRAFKCQTI